MAPPQHGRHERCDDDELGEVEPKVFEPTPPPLQQVLKLLGMPQSAYKSG